VQQLSSIASTTACEYKGDLHRLMLVWNPVSYWQKKLPLHEMVTLHEVHLLVLLAGHVACGVVFTQYQIVRSIRLATAWQHAVDN
jgi:hypothetical protein